MIDTSRAAEIRKYHDVLQEKDKEIIHLKESISELAHRFNKLKSIAKDFYEVYKNDRCFFDHHGYCQEHFLEEDCMVGRLRDFISDEVDEK